MKYIEDAYVKCPFYHKDGYGVIVCEGLYDGTFNRITFKRTSEKFKNSYCRKDYSRCRLFKALMEKYPE